jgi:surface protein
MHPSLTVTCPNGTPARLRLCLVSQRVVSLLDQWSVIMVLYLMLWWCRIPSIIGMFVGASVFNGDLSKWDTSKVTDMQCKSKSCFSSWSIKCHYVVISHALMMSYSIHYIAMFYSASAFNGDVSKWDTSNVTNMSCKSKSCFSSWSMKCVIMLLYLMLWWCRIPSIIVMFFSASAFGQTLCWNTTAVTSSGSMFTNTNGAGFNTTAYPGCLA